MRFHLNYATLRQHRDQLRTRRLIPTHMGPTMLARLDEVPDELAHDGFVLYP